MGFLIKTMDKQINEKFLTAREIADLLRVDIMTIYRYIKAGKIKAYKIGKEFRINKDDFIKFVEKSKV